MDFIQDDDVAAWAKTLPTDSYLSMAVRLGNLKTRAALCYHVGAGLAAVAGVASPRLITSAMQGGRIYANIWTLLVGMPADYKTTALKLATDPLARAFPSQRSAIPGSVEGLYDDLMKNPIQLMYVDEFGELASRSQKQHLVDLKPTLTKLFDCQPATRTLAKKSVRVDDPRLSMAAAGNYAFVTKHTEPVDWDGGFMSRFLIFNGRPRAEEPAANVDATLLEEAMQARLVDLAGIEPGYCAGVTTEGVTMLETFREECREFIGPVALSNPAIAGIAGRAIRHVIATALILSLDTDPNVQAGRWTISDTVLEQAIRVGYWHVRSSVDIVTQVRGCADAIQQHELLQFIRTMAADREARKLSPVVSTAEMIRGLGWGMKRLSDTLAALQEAQQIRTPIVDNGRTFYGLSTEFDPEKNLPHYAREVHVDPVESPLGPWEFN